MTATVLDSPSSRPSFTLRRAACRSMPSWAKDPDAWKQQWASESAACTLAPAVMAATAKARMAQLLADLRVKIPVLAQGKNPMAKKPVGGTVSAHKSIAPLAGLGWQREPLGALFGTFEGRGGLLVRGEMVRAERADKRVRQENLAALMKTAHARLGGKQKVKKATAAEIAAVKRTREAAVKRAREAAAKSSREAAAAAKERAKDAAIREMIKRQKNGKRRKGAKLPVDVNPLETQVPLHTLPLETIENLLPWLAEQIPGATVIIRGATIRRQDHHRHAAAVTFQHPDLEVGLVEYDLSLEEMPEGAVAGDGISLLLHKPAADEWDVPLVIRTRLDGAQEVPNVRRAALNRWNDPARPQPQGSPFDQASVRAYGKAVAAYHRMWDERKGLGAGLGTSPTSVEKSH